jgi:hypothetical protein
VTLAQSVGLVTATNAARQVSQSGWIAVQTQLWSIHDDIQKRRSRSAGVPPLGYAEEDVDQALSYADQPTSARAAKSKTLPAAPPAAPPDSGWAIWGQGFGDFEQRSGNVGGVDVGRTTHTWGGIAGIDKTFINVFGMGDALVVGALGGDITAGISNNDGSSSRLNGSSVGAYLIWVNGSFSIDSAFKADLLSLDQSNAGGLGLTNYVSSLNLYQKYDFKTWWLEPTVGVSGTRTIWNSTGQALGISDGSSFRVQGGARVGTQFQWGTIPVEATLTGLLYDDVSISGGTIANVVGGTLVPTGQGLIFGQGIGRLQFDWSQSIKGLSTYIEGQVRGSSGVFGAGGKLGVRFQW